MKNKAILGLTGAILAIGLMLGGCGSAEQPQTEAPAAEAPAAEAPAKVEAKAQTAAYPIDYCIVSGEKLGSMGDPVDFEHNGRTVKLCCSGCLKTIQASPAMYIAKLDSAAAGLMEGAGHDSHEGHNH